MNKYLQAIERNEVRDFLFGYGEYFERNYEWGEEAGHNQAQAFGYIISYGEEIGFDKLFRRLEFDFTSILENNDISAFEYAYMLYYIEELFHYYADTKRRPFDWTPSDRLCELYRLNFERLKNSDLYESYLSEVDFLKKEYNLLLSGKTFLV